MKKKTLLIAVAILTIGCATKKTVTITEKEFIRDTVFKDKLIKIQVPVKQVVEIEKPCDSLGNLKDFSQVVETDNVRVVVRTVNNTIRAEVNLDSIKSATINEYKALNSDKTTVKEVEIVRYKTNWFWIILAVTMTLWKFKKYIPYLNLLPF